MQTTFNPINFGFIFTDDNWYTFDHEAAHKAALKARNTEARRLRAQGQKVSCYTRKGQLMSRGGIGSNNPHIELFVNVFCLQVN